MCNFFTYIRYIQQGLVRQDGERPLVADRGGARERRRGAGRVSRGRGQPQHFAALLGGRIQREGKVVN